MNRFKKEVWNLQLFQATRFSVDCKMFGAYCYLSEVKGTVPLLHGPLGCAFFPKLVPPDAIRTQLLGLSYPPPFPCTNMDERDVIYGGADKLAKAIIQVDRQYRPELIGVIVSCPAAIIGDDIVEIVDSVKTKINADIIYTPSSAGFADDERIDDINKFADDIVNLWKKPEKKSKFGIEKCGRLDTLYSMIEQLVEKPAEKIKNSINIDTYGRFHYFENLAGELQEIQATFKEIGVKVNTVFPGCSVSDIKTMARAELNFMRRSERSAQFFKEKFGIDYIFDPLGSCYMGISGIKKFYLDVAERFGLHKRALQVVKEKEKNLERDIKEIRKEIKGKKIAYTLTSLTATPNFVETLEYLGVEIKIVIIDIRWWKRWGFSASSSGKVTKELTNQIKSLYSNVVFYVDLNIEEEIERIKEAGVDLAIADLIQADTSRRMLYENNGIKAISSFYMGYSPYRMSFSQIVHLGKMIASKLRTPLPERNLLYLKNKYHKYRFPTLITDLSEELLWEEVMEKVWRDKNGI